MKVRANAEAAGACGRFPSALPNAMRLLPALLLLLMLSACTASQPPHVYVADDYDEVPSLDAEQLAVVTVDPAQVRPAEGAALPAGADTIAAALNRVLPTLVPEETAFEQVLLGTPTNDTSLEVRGFDETAPAVRLLLPPDGDTFAFPDVEPTFVLTFGDVIFLETDDGEPQPVEVRWGLWDNRSGQIAAYGTARAPYDADAGTFVRILLIDALGDTPFAP